MPADSGPTYLNWLENICEYCAQHHVAENMAAQAHSFCAEMFEKYPDRVLLHGDLHQPDTAHVCPDREHIEGVIRLLGEQSGYPAADITKLFYMETVLENIWCVENGDEMNRREIELAEAQRASCMDEQQHTR